MDHTRVLRFSWAFFLGFAWLLVVFNNPPLAAAPRKARAVTQSVIHDRAGASLDDVVASLDKDLIARLAAAAQEEAAPRGYSGLLRKAALVTGALAAAWFGQAFAAVAARALYPRIYALLTGWDPDEMSFWHYYGTYIPSRERFVVASFNYAPAIATVCYGGACLLGKASWQLGRWTWGMGAVASQRLRALLAREEGDTL